MVGRLSRGKGLQVLRVVDMDVLVDHRAADLGSLNACRMDGAYGRMIRTMDLPEHPSVLDVGANIGGFPVLLRLLGLRPRRLVSVELNPRTFARLRCNIEGNFEQAEVLNCGVTADGRPLSVVLDSSSTSDSIYSSRPGRPMSISGATFDEVANHIDGESDLCKVDIEHAEREVFSRESRHIESLQRVRNLLIEIHPADALQSVSDQIEASGLTWRGHEHGTPRPSLGVNWYSRGR